MLQLCINIFVKLNIKSYCFILQTKQQNFAAKDPITHPLYGTSPAQNIPYNNGYGDVGQSLPLNQGPPYGQHPPQEGPQILQPAGFPQPSAFNTQPLNISNYGQQAAKPVQQQTVRDIQEKPQPVEKQPIPDEHVILQTVFEDLRNKCTCAANNPVSKYIRFFTLIMKKCQHF